MAAAVSRLVFLISLGVLLSLPADTRCCFASTFAEAEGQPLGAAEGGQGTGFAEVIPWIQSGRRASVFAPP